MFNDSATPDCRHAVVAIDGPVASGKTSVGQAAAARLQLRFLDTGIMYRAVTWLALHQEVPVDDSAAVDALARSCRMTVGELPDASVAAGDGMLTGPAPEGISIDGYSPGAELRSTQVDDNVSAVSALPGVRAALVQQQRAIGEGGGIVMAGRDIASVVLPDADVKLYIDASPEERARRRFAQQQNANPGVQFEQVLADTLRRDALDTQRADSPLVVAEGAIVINTDNIDLEQTVAAVVDTIRSAIAAGAGPKSQPSGSQRQT